MFCQTLAPPRARRSFIPSILIHVAGAVLLSMVWVWSPVVEIASKSFVAVFVPTNTVAKAKPVARRVTRLPALRRRHALVVPRVALPVRPVTIPAPPPAPVPKLRVAAGTSPLLVPAAAPPAVRPAIQTDVFSGIAPAPPAAPKAALPVDTGSFLPVATAQAAPPRRQSTSTGLFGATEVRQAPAIVESEVTPSGFADAQAVIPAPRRNLATVRAGFGGTVPKPAAEMVAPAVHAGGFGSVSIQQPAARRQSFQAHPVEVEILFKPRPLYSDEARKLKIEGEVLVEVVFTAAAKVRVLRVVQGLGHGLDEAAIQAAANIRFKPAERDGHAVDSPAVARILFSLAY